MQYLKFNFTKHVNFTNMYKYVKIINLCCSVLKIIKINLEIYYVYGYRDSKL